MQRNGYKLEKEKFRKKGQDLVHKGHERNKVRRYVGS